MLRGTRGEVLPQPWFQKLRANSADMFVFVSYPAAFVITIMFSMLTSRTTPQPFVWFVEYGIWFTMGFLYLALGTKLAHQFLLWGICLVGVLVSLLGVWGAVSVLSLDSGLSNLLGVSMAPTGLYVFELLLSVGAAAAFGYAGVQVHRGMAHISARPNREQW
jgi:hypothetical protein